MPQGEAKTDYGQSGGREIARDSHVLCRSDCREPLENGPAGAKKAGQPACHQGGGSLARFQNEGDSIVTASQTRQSGSFGYQVRTTGATRR